MKQKMALTKRIGFIFIVIGTLLLLGVFLIITDNRGESSNLGLFSIATAIVIATGAWLINDDKNDDSNTKT